MTTPFRQVTGHAGNIRLRLILLAGLAGTMLGQGTSLCGKYSLIVTATDPPCHRVGILPWLIAIPGQWETELRLGVGGDTVQFSFYSSLSLTSNHTNLVVEDNEFGSTFFEGLSALRRIPISLDPYPGPMWLLQWPVHAAVQRSRSNMRDPKAAAFPAWTR
jgi:hypothetical protein